MENTMIKRIQNLNFTPTTKELAQEFCDMDGDEQAEFLNLIFEISSGWDNSLCFQMQSVADSKKLNSGGRKVMELMGEYSTPNET